MKNTITTMQSSLPLLGVKSLQIFGVLKQRAALSCLLAFAGAPFTLWAGKAPPPPPSYAYSLRQLSLPAGASSFSANGLNNPGQVVGEADFPNNEYVGCFWQTNGQTVQLPLLAGAQIRHASAGSITDSNLLIAGFSVLYYITNNAVPYDGQRATFWENTPTGFQARDWNDLMPPALGIHLIGSEVSLDGQYVVLSGPDRQTGAAVATVIAQIITNANGSITGINVLDVLENIGPQAINSDGAGVVRVLGGTGGSNQPFLWKKTADGGISLLVAPVGDIAAQKIGAVNKSGQVANTYGTLSNTEALRWEETQLWDLTQATPLGSLGGSLADARDINDVGQVVGAATLAGRTAPQRAYIFNNGSMTDLNMLAPVGNLVLQGANRINNSGQILAFAPQSHSTTASVWVLLTPNP
jgi:probable HAF family extracellular repeat protein